MNCESKDKNGSVCRQTSTGFPLNTQPSTGELTTFEYTPSPSYEDVTQLGTLPKVKLKAGFRLPRRMPT